MNKFCYNKFEDLRKKNVKNKKEVEQSRCVSAGKFLFEETYGDSNASLDIRMFNNGCSVTATAGLGQRKPNNELSFFVSKKIGEFADSRYVLEPLKRLHDVLFLFLKKELEKNESDFLDFKSFEFPDFCKKEKERNQREKNKKNYRSTRDGER